MSGYGVLSSPQKALLPQLSGVTDAGYTLYGGTAVALQLGHRESVDFDFFSAKPLAWHVFRARFVDRAMDTLLKAAQWPASHTSDCGHLTVWARTLHSAAQVNFAAPVDEVDSP